MGDLPLDLSGVTVNIAVATKRLLSRDDAEGLIPGGLLRKYHVIFDYPAQELTLARPGSRKPLGGRVDAPIGPTGFPRIELAIAGKTYGFLLDTGATYTMISREVLEGWSGAHTDWPHAAGAVGAANMSGGPREAGAMMLRVPVAEWGQLRMESFAAVSRGKGTFETYMSEMMTAPIVGAIGGNVLKTCRVEIDYANGAVYLQKTGMTESHDLDLVGLTLAEEEDGRVTISGVSAQNVRSVLDGLYPGDRLVRVDALEVTGMSLSAIQKSLSGQPGDIRKLQIKREGKPHLVQAVVTRIL